MDFSIKSVDVINLFIEDVAGTKAFYQDVLGLQAAFEDEKNAVFKLANIMIHLLDVSDAPDMIAPAMVARPEAGSRFVIAAFVDNVDEVCAELARRGVELLNGPVDRPWGVRTASFSDPAGHLWEIAQELP